MINMQKDIIPEVRIKTTLWFRWIPSSDLWGRVKLHTDDVSLAPFPGENSSPERTATPSYTCCFYLKGWKSTKAEASFKCSHMARGTWMDVVFHSQGVHSGLMQKHCLRIIPHVIQDGVTLWQGRLEVRCSSPSIEKPENSGGGKPIFFSFAYIFSRTTEYLYVLLLLI